MSAADDRREPGFPATYEWIVAFIATYGYPPTIREVADAMGIGVNTAAYRIGVLVRLGQLERDPNVARGLRVVAP